MAGDEHPDWTDAELDLIVADYFDMLGEEIVGISFNKAAHNCALRDQINRSKSSIEFKHRNVSAVLVTRSPHDQGVLPRRELSRSDYRRR